MITESLLRMLIAIHKHQPITGNVLALGKQSIVISPKKILALFKEQNCEVNPNGIAHLGKKDNETRHRQKESIDDQVFFNLFSDVKYDTMDVSTYENASIIHDLNYPVPPELEEKFDFIIDGGTFDHLFDIKTAFANITKMLKPNGRIFQWNAASNFANAAYLSFSADFFHDYFVLNKFADCRTFFAESYSMSAQNWCLYEFIPPANNRSYPLFRASPFTSMVLVYAKKTQDTTCNRMPIQLQYRDKELLAEYTNNKAAYSESSFSISRPKFHKLALPLRHRIMHSLIQDPCRKTYKYHGWL